MTRASREKLGKRGMDAFWMWLAWRLPRRLRYWATIRSCAIATTGEWANEESPGVTIGDLLRRI